MHCRGTSPSHSVGSHVPGPLDVDKGQLRVFADAEAGHGVVAAVGREEIPSIGREDDAACLAGRAVMAAAGGHYGRLDAVGLEEFEGDGVYDAATNMKGPAVRLGAGGRCGVEQIRLVKLHHSSQGAGCPVTIVICGSDLAQRVRTGPGAGRSR